MREKGQILPNYIFPVADTEVVDHDNTDTVFPMMLGNDDDLTDNERNNVHEDKDHGKAKVEIIEDARRCNDVFTEMGRNYDLYIKGTDSALNVKSFHIYEDNTGNIYDVVGYDYWSYIVKSIVKH
ncbi:hypothetical protein GJ496_011839 [Pomphorhynchus laevis]|nr:hypothetical protein GJ496_011839 [Pomphorhynchus laevis]